MRIEIVLLFFVFIYSIRSFSQENTFPTTGDVGVNTLSPREKFDVEGTAIVNYLKIAPAYPGQLEGGELKLLGAGNHAAWHFDNYNGHVRLHRNGATPFILTSDGKMGINNGMPQTTLDVNGTAKVNYLSIAAELNSSIEGGQLELLGANNYDIWKLDNYAGTLRFFNSNIIGFVLTDEGDLGISSSTPKQKLDVNGGIKIGNTITSEPGSIRWTGSDFEGYNGTEWVSLSTEPEDLPSGTWIPAFQQSGTSWYPNPCAASCYHNSGLIASADPNGFVCKGTNGTLGINALSNGINPYTCTGPGFSYQLSQCYCLFPNSDNNFQNGVAIDNTTFLKADEIKINTNNEQTVYNLSIGPIYLEQNYPNPFHDNTQIRFTTPQNFTIAELEISDIDGNRLKSLKINNSGKGVLNLEGMDLLSGIYQYALYIDGKLVDSKTMIKQ